MKLVTTLILTSTALLLSSCGSSKSSQATLTTNNQSSIVTNSGNKVLTSCQKSTGSDMSINISAVKNSLGEINNSLVKIKFNRLSAAATASGNVIRFFKWKVSGNQAYLDQTALSSARYVLSTGNVDQSSLTSVIANTVTLDKGYYIDLQDESGAYQVLKAVVYSSVGTIVSQHNILIPQFLGAPADYAYNSDGSARAQILRDLHPLASADVSAWSAADYSNYYSATCF